MAGSRSGAGRRVAVAGVCFAKTSIFRRVRAFPGTPGVCFAKTSFFRQVRASHGTPGVCFAKTSFFDGGTDLSTDGGEFVAQELVFSRGVGCIEHLLCQADYTRHLWPCRTILRGVAACISVRTGVMRRMMAVSAPDEIEADEMEVLSPERAHWFGASAGVGGRGIYRPDITNHRFDILIALEPLVYPAQVLLMAVNGSSGRPDASSRRGLWRARPKGC